MADGRHPEVETKAETLPAQRAEAEKSTLNKFLEEAYVELGKLGIGPLSTLKETTLLLPQEDARLPNVDIFDAAKLPAPEAAPAAPAEGTSPLVLPIKLEMPSIKFEGEGYSVKVTPTGNPLKHKGGIEVAGTF